MRLAAALLFLVTLACMAAAAYLTNGWKLALYGAIVAGTLFSLTLLSAIGEHLAGSNRPWIRALLALVAGGFALVQSRAARPGTVGNLPFHDLTKSGLSVAALACMLGAVGLGVATLRLDKRGANVVAGLGMLLALFALGPWLGK